MIAFGRTTPGATDWKSLPNERGIYVDVDTSSANFASDAARPVVYVASLGGKNQHWATTGGSSIYMSTHNKFRVYVRWVDNSRIIPDYANQVEWHINWFGQQLP